MKGGFHFSETVNAIERTKMCLLKKQCSCRDLFGGKVVEIYVKT